MLCTVVLLHTAVRYYLCQKETRNLIAEILTVEKNLGKKKHLNLQMPKPIIVRLAMCAPGIEKQMHQKFQPPDGIPKPKSWLWRCTPSPTTFLSAVSYAALHGSRSRSRSEGEVPSLSEGVHSYSVKVRIKVNHPCCSLG